MANESLESCTSSNRACTCKKSMSLKVSLSNLRRQFKAANYQNKLLKDTITEDKYRKALKNIFTDNQIKVLCSGKKSRYWSNDCSTSS